jgi:regulator of protease activity HflC (stomatin/prohibitin superfamily)
VGQLFQLILDNLYKLWPYRIVDADCQGIRHWRGGMTLLLPKGHWFVPGLQEIETYNTVYQNVDCGEQSLTTKDGKRVTLSCNLGYRINDLVKMRLSYWHFDKTLVNEARGVVYEVVTTHTLVELLADPEVIQKVLLQRVRKEFEGSGVRMLSAKLDQLVEVKPYKVFGSTPSPLGID